jgi:putative ubiquitin-RnfH superfamily antitoxin RatB of RatAB toxin-antitoxin module
MEHAEPARKLRVSVAYSPAAGQVDEVVLSVERGATLADALRLSGMLERHPAIDPSVNRVGIWGQLRQGDAVLRDGDRVEVYRPLVVDPKDARRQRERQQRDARAAGNPSGSRRR